MVTIMDDKYIFHLVIQNKFDIETIADTIAKLIEKKMDKEDILNRAYKYYINKATPQERSNYEEVLGSLLWEQLKQHNYKFSKAKKYIAENILTNHIVEKLKDRPISKLDVKENTQEDNYMYKQFYTIGFKDGLNAILESIK